MKERPIPFSAPMVRALLAGTKTQTRRVMKPQPLGGMPTLLQHLADIGHQRWATDEPDEEMVWKCPYGQPGDRLWVRHSAAFFPVYFKPIPGWEGLYAAGTDGLIYRMDRGEPAALSGSPTSKGYLTVSLSRGQAETHAVYKLVCEAYYGSPPFDGAQVRHMDGEQTNNRPENLDWGSQEQNWQDRKVHGRGMGQDHHAAKLTPAAVEVIKASASSQRELAREFGVSQATIWEAKHGRSWAEHAPEPRNMPAFKMWKPSIHMPRWASRITLEVTGVRVERVQDISIADAMAEGVVECNESLRGLEPCMEWRYAYEDLWNSINGPGAWDSNPWVWVVGFRRIDADQP